MAGSRAYRSQLRDDQVRLTRRRVIDAAQALFLAAGYAGTTVDAIAARADVSPQTIYNVVGGKAKLLKAVYDVTLAGDDEPVPMNDRAPMKAMLEAPDAPTCLRGYAAFCRAIVERIGPLMAVVAVQAGSGDRDLSAFVETVERERATGNSGVVRHVEQRFGLRPGLSGERAADIVWVLTAAETAARLIGRRGWSHNEYEEWLGDTLIAQLLPQPAAVRPWPASM